MGRFPARFGTHLVRSFGEQLVGGVLAVLILVFQLRYGLIRKAEAQGAWWSIIWPYLILAGLLVLSCAIKTWWELRQEDSAKAREAREYSKAQAALLWTFEAQAAELLLALERAWHHWHNAGEVLLHPLDENTAKSSESVDLQLELRDFKLTYGKHLQRIALDVSAFTSRALVEGYPSSREYIEVLYDLREHREKLDSTALELYQSGKPLGD
jgi:hypothetical protein